MRSYGFKIPDEWDDAKKLIDEFRKDQQRVWEGEQRTTTTNTPITNPPSTSDTTSTNSEDIALAVLWHRRMGHLNYHALKHLPLAASGIPNLKFNIDDIPICEVCGLDDRATDG